ncbi:hypothetical protein BTO30_11485 [Domibacillus antri]|uniref:ABC transporter substrate-binding protein n=1 Tax=Domibacillus antri TaxID=1714264 RepID=A0A1Q8Q452_9BACI|nr:tripartite tricarboxylate transporter substrate binding protein [Domibacillus antri]OLN22107.1 hypothetical protein BTO30_11485 [Domibacillus antri]
MKKLVMLSLLILSLILGGCSQTQTASSENNEGQANSDFPKKPIQLIVPYASGSSTEMIARVLAKGAEKYIPNGQSVVVVNKPGGAATIGATEVHGAKPDGYTLGMLTVSQLSLQPLFGKTVFTHDSFQPILKATVVPQFLTVKSDAPWKTFEEWLEYVKKNPNKFTYATVGAGSTVHISMEALNAAANIKTKAVHFESGGETVTAVLGGHTQGASLLPQTAKEYVKSGDFRILANLGSYKPEGHEDIPLLKEKGLDAEVDVFTGVVAPKGLPKDIQKVIHDAFKQALEDPEVQKQLKEIDVDPKYAGPEEFQKEITESYNEYGEILKNIGLIQ